MENPPISKPITECIQVSGVVLYPRALGLTFGRAGFLGVQDTALGLEGANILDKMLFNSLII